MDDGHTVPIIRLTVESMKYSLLAAMTARGKNYDDYVKETVDEFCKEDNLRRVMGECVEQELTRQVKQSVSNYFAFGDGAIAVKSTVKEILDAKFGLEQK